MSKLKAAEAVKMDLYGMMRLRAYASDKEVKRAYRKQALKLHPDKNPNNPNAAKNFQNLQKAFELLTDPVEKGEYDRLLKAKEAAEERRREQDEKTRSFREKLEKREKELKKQKEERDEYQEIERQRRMAERDEEERVMEEERMERQKQIEKLKERERKEYNVKVKWSRGCDYGSDTLKEVFSKYGRLQEVVMRESARVALLQYDNQLSAIRCLEENNAVKKKLKVELMFQVDYKQADDDENDDFEELEKHFLRTLQQKAQKSKETTSSKETDSKSDSKAKSDSKSNLNRQPANRDYESLHDRSLRQAEERKRLIEEMMKNED